MCGVGRGFSKAIQKSSDCAFYPFRSGFDIPVGDMRVAQRDLHAPMTEQPRHERRRNPLHNGMAGEGVPDIVRANILDPRPFPYLAPERKLVQEPRIRCGRKDVWASGPKLAFGDGAGLCVQEDLPIVLSSAIFSVRVYRRDGVWVVGIGVEFAETAVPTRRIRSFPYPNRGKNVHSNTACIPNVTNNARVSLMVVRKLLYFPQQLRHDSKNNANTPARCGC